jgi:hypothetical protein
MPMSLEPRRALFAVAVLSAVPLLVACPKKETPVVIEAGPPPVVEEAGPTVIAPLEELDAGVDADAAPPKKFTGPAVNPNTARIKQCCNALRAESKKQGNPPEFGAVIGSCDQMAAAAGTTGNAPELGALKGLMAGRTMPAVCAGF